MNRNFSKRNVAVGAGFLVAVLVCIASVLAGIGKIEDVAVQAAYEKGSAFYENNELDKAIATFNEGLSVAFSKPAYGQLQQAISLAKSGKADEAEKILLSLSNQDETAARARYEMGQIYEAQGKIDKAATLFRNALVTIANRGAKYTGVKGCRKCHIKQYKSWKKTKMAKTFDVLKPGTNAEAKKNNGFDPEKDYTKDPKCLACHTTGYSLPGGYAIPAKGDPKNQKTAKDNESVTCEACHGPGSKYGPLHKIVLIKKQKYESENFHQAGQYKIDAPLCTSCHNRRNPTVGQDFTFDYEQYRAQDTHENFPLKFKQE